MNSKDKRTIIEERIILVVFICIIIIIPFIFMNITGCASTNLHDVEVQRAYFEAQAKIAEAENNNNINQGPTVEMICRDGCRFERFTVNIPGDDEDTHHTILNRPKTSAETGAEVSKAYARPIESIFTMGLGIFGINEIVKNVGKYSGNSTEMSGDNNSISKGNTISSADGNQRDTITSTDMQSESNSSVCDAISSDSNDLSTIDSNDTIDNSDNSKVVNNYPISDSNNTNNSNQDNPIDNTNQNQTTEPYYPPILP